MVVRYESADTRYASDVPQPDIHTMSLLKLYLHIVRTLQIALTAHRRATRILGGIARSTTPLFQTLKGSRTRLISRPYQATTVELALDQ